MAKHLLVSNDYPPKIGGIQSYLWELWRRLPPEEVAVFTTWYDGSKQFDAQEPYHIQRSQRKIMLPTQSTLRSINALAEAHDADIVLLDPALPLGLLGPKLERPFGLILHGAEVAVPGRLPISKQVLGRLLRKASLVIAAGTYPLREAERAAGTELRSVVVPPGVDCERFVPLSAQDRRAARQHFGVGEDDFLVATVNRLVPRKGIGTVIRSVADIQKLRPKANVQLLVGGSGRERASLERLIKTTGSRTRLLGKIPDGDVARLYGCADLMAMMCNERWLGLEQEGFGIAFLEAAASGVPQVAGRSGGSHEAVADGTTGSIVNDSRSVSAVTSAIITLLDDEERRRDMGRQARIRATQAFDYDQLAKDLQSALEELELPNKPG